MSKRPPQAVNAPSITIRLRYSGDDRKLSRLDGREIADVPGTQEAVYARLKREVGPLVVIEDVEEDGDFVIVTLGDPPKGDSLGPTPEQA